MYLPPARQSEIAVELARHIGQEFEARAYRPDRNGRASRMRLNTNASGNAGGLIRAAKFSICPMQTFHTPASP